MAQTRGRKPGTVSQPVTQNWEALGENSETAELPKSLRKSAVDDTPFPQWLTESWETGEARVLKDLTQAQYEEAKRLVTIAVRRLGIFWGEKTGARHHVAVDDDGKVTYSFVMVDRKKPGNEDAEADESGDSDE